VQRYCGVPWGMAPLAATSPWWWRLCMPTPLLDPAPACDDRQRVGGLPLPGGSTRHAQGISPYTTRWHPGDHQAHLPGGCPGAGWCVYAYMPYAHMHCTFLHTLLLYISDARFAHTHAMDRICMTHTQRERFSTENVLDIRGCKNIAECCRG
jgi:hypothetical protein